MFGSKANSVVFFLVFVFAVNAINAQDDFTSEYVEYRSYQLYLKKDWKALLALGDSALAHSNDYYYLRMRLGIAEYEQEHYLLAQNHFTKAIEFNSLEDLPNEYLYYCYVFTQRFEESRNIASKFSSVLKKKIGYDQLKEIDFIAAEYGKKITTIYDVPDAITVGISLNHYLFKKISVFHGYLNYTQSSDYWRISQNQYYVRMNVPCRKNLLFSTSFHYAQSNVFDVKKNLKSDLLTTNNYVGSFLISKRFKKHEFDLGSTLVRLDSVVQYQHDFTYAFYPFANSKLCIGAKAYLHTNNNYSKLNFAVLPFVSFTPSSRLNLFANYLYNQGNNIVEWNGFLLNNSQDLTSSRFSVTATLTLSQKIDLSATYQNESKVARYTPDYSFNSFFISLKFKP